jgi:hypothetical protein
MAYTITKRRTAKGIAFDLYFRWKGQRYRPLLGYDLSPDQAQQCAIELIHRIQTQEVEKPRSLLTLHDILRCIGRPSKSKNASIARAQKEFWRITSCPAMPASETTILQSSLWTSAAVFAQTGGWAPICEGTARRRGDGRHRPS